MHHKFTSEVGELVFEIVEGQPRCFCCPMHEGYYDDSISMWKYVCKLQKREYFTMRVMELQCKLIEKNFKGQVRLEKGNNG